MHTFNIDGLARPLRVVRFTGHESISQPFQFEVTFRCEDQDLPAQQVVGRPATLAIHVGEEPRRMHGIVSRLSHGDPMGTSSTFQATLVPAMWRMRLRVDSRIYQGLSVPEI